MDTIVIHSSSAGWTIHRFYQFVEWQTINCNHFFIVNTVNDQDENTNLSLSYLAVLCIYPLNMFEIWINFWGEQKNFKRFQEN